MAKAQVDLTDSFDVKLSTSFPGYNSASDKTTLPPGYLVRGSKNVYVKISGTIAARPGLLLRGQADTTVAAVITGDTWYTSLGKTIPWRVANNLLQVESSITGSPIWYSLYETSTLNSPAATYTRFIVSPWWDNVEKKDRLLMVRGDSKLLHWSGGISEVASGTINTITKLDTTTTWAQDGFATNTAGEKKLIISGVEYTYTGGENTSILTGVTPDASALASGSIAIQSVMVETSTPASTFNSDFIKVIGNQAFVGSYTSRLIYISASNNFKNYTVPTPRAPGDPELLTLDDTSTAITVSKGNAWISAGLSDWYEISFENITVGSTLTQTTKVDKKPTSIGSAALAHEFVDTIGDDIVALTRDQQVRRIGNFRNLFQTKYPSLSQQVYTEFSEEDFDGGQLKAIGDFIYITAPNTGRDWMHQTREFIDDQGNVVAQRLWHPPQVRNLSRFTVIDDVIYGYSNANPQTYQVWDTNQWHDDSPSGEYLSYNCVAKFSYVNNNRRQGLLEFNRVYYEGYITSGTNLYGNVYFDYQGSTGISNVILNSNNSPAKLFIASNAPSLGDSSLGDNPLGDGLTPESNDQELLPKFRVICNVTTTDCFEYQLEVYSDDIDSRWELLAVGANHKMSENNAVFLQH